MQRKSTLVEYGYLIAKKTGQISKKSMEPPSSAPVRKPKSGNGSLQEGREVLQGQVEHCAERHVCVRTQRKRVETRSEFKHNGYACEFDVQTPTGKILKWEKEYKGK